MFDTVVELLDAADRKPPIGRRAAKNVNFGMDYLQGSAFGMQQVIHTDPNVEKGKAIHANNGTIVMHPDDYAELRKKIEGQQQISVGYKP